MVYKNERDSLLMKDNRRKNSRKGREEGVNRGYTKNLYHRRIFG